MPVLQIGPNLVGLEQLAADSVFELLEQFGGSEVTSGLSRFDRETGRFETTIFDGTEPAGIDFGVARGEAFWL